MLLLLFMNIGRHKMVSTAGQVISGGGNARRVEVAIGGRQSENRGNIILLLKWFIQSFLCIKDGDAISTFSGFNELPR
jgi:hypothetical protein